MQENFNEENRSRFLRFKSSFDYALGKGTDNSISERNSNMRNLGGNEIRGTKQNKKRERSSII